jgi:predicted exporter
MLAVLASDLQAVPGTAALELDVTLRNRAPYPQALPALELTLTDTRGQVISRRVFMPAEYGAPAQASLAPGADLAARVLFEVKDGVPAGFLVYPFYP